MYTSFLSCDYGLTQLVQATHGASLIDKVFNPNSPDVIGEPTDYKI